MNTVMATPSCIASITRVRIRGISAWLLSLCAMIMSLQAGAVITEQQAIERVCAFIGDPNAKVVNSSGPGVMNTMEEHGYTFEYWANLDPDYSFECANRSYFVNALTGCIEMVSTDSDLTVYPADALNAEEMWSKFSDLPRDQMQLHGEDNWELRYADGTWNPFVRLSFDRDEQGSIKGVYVWNKPIPLPLPTPTMTPKQAVSIAKSIAGSYTWNDYEGNICGMPYFDVLDIDGIKWHINQKGDPEAVYEVTFLISDDPAVNVSWADEQSEHGLAGCGLFYVNVDAFSGAILQADASVFLCAKTPPATKKGVRKITAAKAKTKTVTATVRMVPLRTMMALAPSTTISAKPGEKAFTLDGKRIPLPYKVAAQSGKYYLPWQALKYLPGVKVSFDAKMNRLDITTTGTGKPKSSMKKKVQQ
ncbi:MAG: hypothetical protein ACYC1M_06465 [Armatimonadota bacterium]